MTTGGYRPRIGSPFNPDDAPPPVVLDLFDDTFTNGNLNGQTNGQGTWADYSTPPVRLRVVTTSGSQWIQNSTSTGNADASCYFAPASQPAGTVTFSLLPLGIAGGDKNFALSIVDNSTTLHILAGVQITTAPHSPYNGVSVVTLIDNNVGMVSGTVTLAANVPVQVTLGADGSNMFVTIGTLTLTLAQDDGGATTCGAIEMQIYGDVGQTRSFETRAIQITLPG